MNKRRLIGSLVVVCGLACLKVWSDDEVRKAQSFCDGLIPYLQKELEKTGRYPDNLNTELSDQKRVPRLLSLKTAYTGHGDFFYFRFRVPWQLGDNIYGFNSRTGRWMRYD